ncbi:MAG: DNA primase [Bacilli bacterium]|nr:DNA primase [Bacilli bacterium]
MGDFQDLIHEVQEKADIVNIISRYIKLEKKGAGYVGLCPFHDDKNPSLSVSPSKKIYKCFSCNASGNVITFVEQYKKIPFMEALREVASTVNIPVAITKAEQEVKKNQKYYDVMIAAQNFYHFYLKNTEEGQLASEYCHSRHLDPDIIERFGIGCSPKEVDLLFKTLEKQNILPIDMAEVGLVRLSNQYFDMFRNRVMFPITDLNGRIVGFSGRKYEKSSNEPKYINTNDTILFKKGQILYNYHEAFDAIKKADSVILFEGFMDVIASFRAGIYHTVASMGTALTRDQIKAMKRLTSNITICYDGDEPGIEATVRAIHMLAPEDIAMKVVSMPEGLDPDEYLNRYGASKLQDVLLNQTMSGVEFLYEQALKHFIPGNIESMERFKAEVFHALQVFPSLMVRDIYLRKMASLLGVSLDVLSHDMDLIPPPSHPDVNAPFDPIPTEYPFDWKEPEKLRKRFNPKPKYIAIQKDLICLALHHQDRLLEIEHGFNDHYILDEFREIMAKASHRVLKKETIHLSQFASELSISAQAIYEELINPEIEPDISKLDSYFEWFEPWPYERVLQQNCTNMNDDKIKIAIECKQKTVKIKKKE